MSSGQADGGDALALERPVEGLPVLRVAVWGEHSAPALSGQAVEARRLLCHPRGVGVLGARGRDCPPREQDSLSGEIVEEFGGWLEGGDQEVISGAGAGDIEQVAFRVVDVGEV